jgi:hypothetical protein
VDGRIFEESRASSIERPPRFVVVGSWLSMIPRAMAKTVAMEARCRDGEEQRVLGSAIFANRPEANRFYESLRLKRRLFLALSNLKS